MVVSGGYPEDFEKERYLDLETIRPDCFHAGTKLDNGNVVSKRVLAVTSYGNDFEEVKNLIKT
jgi:phosphoribosylamine-glycine ligase